MQSKEETLADRRQPSRRQKLFPKWEGGIWRSIRSGLVPSGKLLAVAIPVAIAFAQYLEQSLQARIDRAEDSFTSSVNQLEANSEAVRAAGVRTLFVLSFRELPQEPVTGLAGLPDLLPKLRPYQMRGSSLPA